MSAIPESLFEKPTQPPENLQRLFRYPVSHHNKAEIFQYLTDTHQSYNKCQLEINKYNALILLLESKKEKLKKSMEKFRSLLSPVHRLPSELLLEIFGYLCEVNVLDHSKMPPASALSMVCGRWRQVTLASPRLWSSISLQLDRSEGRRDKVIANLAQLFLERSKNTALKLRIDFSWHTEWSHDGLSHLTVLRLLEEQSERWEELEVYGRELYASSRSQGDLHLPNLKHLAFYTRALDSPQTSWALDRFKNCPALTSFYSDVADIEDRIELPWGNIRVLKLEDCLMTAALIVLGSCTSLEHLGIRNVGQSSWPEEVMVVSDTIRTLSISGKDCMPTIVSHFTFRHLSSVTIDDTDISSLDLEQFIKRSSCSITTLRLDGLWLTDSQLLSLLRLMPDLRTLEVGECRSGRVITSRFLDRLAADLDNPHNPFLPHLTELRLKISAKELEERALVNALTSRWLPGDSPFASTAMGVDRIESVDVVLLWWNGPPIQDMLSSLQCLRDIGLRLTISHVTRMRD
ncbi:hypothetical protein PQX77_004941 [Marasmius sp. AFHP31]|nr:hypothetical protein PQX77_004941 [Marasmius sp. AFHP31]